MKTNLNPYSINEDRFNRISFKFRHISNTSFYATHIKIAAEEYCNYLNYLGGTVTNINTGYDPQNTFAVKRGGKFAVNTILVTKSIKEARRKGVFRIIGFCKVNVVLDKLYESLLNRK